MRRVNDRRGHSADALDQWAAETESLNQSPFAELDSLESEVLLP